MPDVIAEVEALPFTHNGKASEAAARDAVNGLPVRNLSSLANPGCVEKISVHPALARKRRELPEPGESAEQTEAYLRALWEQLFSFSPIGLDDNFFELGGHSLLAAQMLAEVKRATGRTLPLATLIIAPTIARLAAVIVEDGVQGAHPNLVPMRAGRGRPVFMVHSITGSVMECLTLAGTLQSERPVYGLQARGLDGDLEPQRRVEEMARVYVEQMRAVQPSGPYALVGYSFGGLVAFEIAQQLIAAGEKIELLCLLDTYVDERYLPLPAWVRFQSRGHGRSRAHVPRALRTRAPGLREGQGCPAPSTGSACGSARWPASPPPIRRACRRCCGRYASRCASRWRRIGRAATSAARSSTCARPSGKTGRAIRCRPGSGSRGWACMVKNIDGAHTDLVVEPNLATVADTLARRLTGA